MFQYSVSLSYIHVLPTMTVRFLSRTRSGINLFLLPSISIHFPYRHVFYHFFKGFFSWFCSEKETVHPFTKPILTPTLKAFLSPPFFRSRSQRFVSRSTSSSSLFLYLKSPNFCNWSKSSLSLWSLPLFQDGNLAGIRWKRDFVKIWSFGWGNCGSHPL